MPNNNHRHVANDSITAIQKSITGSRNLTQQSTTTPLMSGTFNPFPASPAPNVTVAINSSPTNQGTNSNDQ